MAGTRNEVGNAVSHPFIDAVERIGTNIDELFPALLGLLPIADRTDAPLLGCHDLHVLDVREAGSIRGDTQDGMPLHTPIRVNRQVILLDYTQYFASTLV